MMEVIAICAVVAAALWMGVGIIATAQWYRLSKTQPQYRRAS